MQKDEPNLQTKAEAALRRHDVLPLLSLGNSAMFSAMKEAMNDRGNWLGQQVCHVILFIHTKMIVTTVKTRTVCELYKSVH
jgi:hypothetical protein